MIKLILKAWFGSTHAIKVLMQKNTHLGRICCHSPFQRNDYCKIVKSYLSTNLIKSEKFLVENSQNNSKLLFLLYNFIKKHRRVDQVELLDDYFHDKHLSVIRKINSEQALYIDNITTAKICECKNDEKKVSVIITVFNCEELVYHAVMSIINQTYDNIEIIVVNDGSTDGTLGVLEGLKVQHPSIKLYTIQNSGTYVARNVGLLYATGDYITFHDADDWAHPQRICEHMDIHKKHDDCSASLSLLARVTPDGYFHSRQIYPVDRNCMVSLMFSHELFEQLGYFRKGRFGNDTEYFERIKKFAEGKIYTIDKVLTICAQRPNSLTTTPETSNEIGKNSRRMNQMKRWRKWHKLCQLNNKTPYISFRLDQLEVIKTV